MNVTVDINRDPSKDLTCPFCGGEVDPEGWLGVEEDPITGDALRRGPECMTCGSTSPDMTTWNTRVTPERSNDQPRSLSRRAALSRWRHG